MPQWRRQTQKAQRIANPYTVLTKVYLNNLTHHYVVSDNHKKTCDRCAQQSELR